MSTMGRNRPHVSAANHPETDLALVQRVAHKDRKAFESLYYAYHRRIFQFVLRLVRRADVADEVVNDVMFVVWERAAAFKGQSRVSTWILGIAYRKALKGLQRLKLRSHADVDIEDALAEASLADEATNPESALDHSILLDHLERGIEALSPEHQSVVELTALGYSYAAISEIVGCPTNTVKTRMFHARRRLKGYLADAAANPTTDSTGETR